KRRRRRATTSTAVDGTVAAAGAARSAAADVVVRLALRSGCSFPPRRIRGAPASRISRPMPASEPETVRRARDGDRSALEALWLRHRGWVQSVLLAHRPRGDDVEDLLQEVAVRVVRGVGSLADEAAFGA